MKLNKVTIIGGGVLGSQIGLMCAYVGKEVTFWLRSESSVERRLRHERPCRGLLGDHDVVGESSENMLVELAQERNSFEIFSSAVCVGRPFAVPAVVVQI